MVVLLLSPIVLIFAAPLAIGAGLDIFEMAGEAPLVLALCAPAVLLPLGILGRAPVRQFIAAHLRLPHHLGDAAGPRYAP